MMMEHKNPVIKLITYGRLKKMMKQFEEQPIDSLERNMIRGMFKRRLKDFAELMKEETNDKTLFERLKESRDA